MANAESSPDPDDPRSALVAAMPEDQYIPEESREELLQRGLALVEQGQSISAAARMVGIRFAALYAKQKSADLDLLNAPDKPLSEAQAVIAYAASERVFARIEADVMSDQNLIRAMNSANDKLLALRQNERPDDKGVSILAQLLQGRRVTIEEKDPADEALDVTPDHSSE